ncbi:MAG: hypothetical protein JO337_12715 [Acidimicrobiales bacterium]|nr:hypothetical protein [Acidimicrobiales bacterium]
MPILKITRGRTAAGALGVLAAVGTAGAVTGAAHAVAGTQSPGASTNLASATDASSPISTTATTVRPHARSLLKRSDHATIELKVKGQWVTYTLDRGKVSAVSPTSMTVARPDGQSVTETINSSTKYRGVASEGAIQLNQPAAVISEGGTALVIRQKPATAPAPATSGAATSGAAIS